MTKIEIHSSLFFLKFLMKKITVRLMGQEIGYLSFTLKLLP